jgi:hypothetical protein
MLVTCFFALISSCSLGATWNPDPSLGNVDQHRRIYEIARHYCEVNFDLDANMIGKKKKHGTGASASYAFGLLLTGDPSDSALAQKILKRVVVCQDTKSDSPTYGVFNWYAEDRPKI